MNPSAVTGRTGRDSVLIPDGAGEAALGREFLQRFAHLLGRIRQEMDAVPGLREVAGEQACQQGDLLAQALLDRFLLLNFVQKKGLLDASPDYLYRRFVDGHAGQPGRTSYYRKVVYPLLLAVTDREANRDLAGSVGAVPFLGGELLGQARPRADLPVTNATFQAVFDQLLRHYDWTLGEEAPAGAQRSVDPQILGRVFEVVVLGRGKERGSSRRRATGSYYTPRPVVAFLVREALAETLAGQSGLDRERIARLLDLPPAARLDGAGRAWMSEAFSPGDCRELKRLLLGIRACDPAAGSGAFLVGLLRAMARAVGLLDWRLGGDAALGVHNRAYDLKKHIVEHCLFGVDLQARAVQICKLRLWLDLLADYELPPGLAFQQAVRQVPTVDSLACQVRQGDSLLERPQGSAAFAWRTDFSAVFREKGGFDLLIGNPPYGARIARDEWAQIKARYPGSGSARNVAAAFLALPFDCLHPRGVACQIVPKSVSFSRGWSRTREVLWDEGCLLASADASQAFEGVLLEQEVLLYRPLGRHEGRPRSWHLRGQTFVEGHRVPLALLQRQDAILNHLSAGAAGLLERLLERGQPLGRYASTTRGASWQSRLVAAGDPGAGARVIRGRDIRQFALVEGLPGLACAPHMEEKLRAMAVPKIVSQNIVAHVTRPYDTLVIVSAVDRSGAAALDTINVTTLLPGCPYPLEYLVALLNSSLARWYFYFGVYNRAVRTMHFDAPYVDRFPVPPASPAQVGRICRLVGELEARQTERDAKYLLYGDDVAYDALDEAIWALYALEAEDISLVLRHGRGSPLCTEEL